MPSKLHTVKKTHFVVAIQNREGKNTHRHIKDTCLVLRRCESVGAEPRVGGLFLDLGPFPDKTKRGWGGGGRDKKRSMRKNEAKQKSRASYFS